MTSPRVSPSLVLFTLLGMLLTFFLVSMLFSKQMYEAFTGQKGIDHVVLKVAPNYLEAAYCNRIRQLAEAKGFEKSKVVTDGKAEGALDPKVRISEQAWLKPEEHPEIMHLYRRVEKMTGIPMTRYEDMQVVRYQTGGHYHEHYDCCRDDEPCDDFWKLGGRRLFTVLVYLNGPEEIAEGGETSFPRLRLKVTPEKGKMLWFRNIRDDGSLEEDSLHAGLPVLRGHEKIACQIWIRQRDRPERITA